MKLDNSALTYGLVGVLIAGALLFGLLAQPTEMGLMIVACAIGLAFVNIDKIQRFKGAGFEAEMKKAVEEAYATTETLKALAKPLVLSILENIIYAGRWGGIDSEKKHDLKEELDKLSVSLGIRDAEIDTAVHKFYIWHGIDHIHHLTTVMGQKHISNDNVRNALRSLNDRSASELPAVEEVRAAVSELKPEEIDMLEPYIKDYEYYRRYGKLRRPEAITE